MRRFDRDCAGSKADFGANGHVIFAALVEVMRLRKVVERLGFSTACSQQLRRGAKIGYRLTGVAEIVLNTSALRAPADNAADAPYVL